MNTIDTVVIGAGQAGLAVSALLTRYGRDHVLLERGQVADRWRRERWDSLRLLTPNWMTRLPGWWYRGSRPSGYMSAAEFVEQLEKYAAAITAPVRLGEEVREVSARRDGYRILTNDRWWQARNVVIATGATGRPARLAGVDCLDPGVAVVVSSQYRNPDQLPPGGVLVVGASASGVQIADELVRTGRRVVLAVGRHNRMPRRYRGMDIFWWLEQTGRLARTIDTVPFGQARGHEPSLQLAGREPADPRGANVDLGVLQSAGVEIVGRLAGVDGYRIGFMVDLPATVGGADAALDRLLDSIDMYAAAHHLDAEVDPPRRPARVPLPDNPLHRLDLRSAGITTVLLATGFQPHHPWLKVPVVGSDGHIQQIRGATPAPGLYVVGQRWQHRRDSTFIDGARHSALDVVTHLHQGRDVDSMEREAS